METIKKLDSTEQPTIKEVHKSWLQQHCITAVQGNVTIPIEGKVTNSVTNEEETVVSHNPVIIASKAELIAEVIRAYPSTEYNMDAKKAETLVNEILELSTNEGTFEKFVEVCNEFK